jgi:hypothetical protein
MTTTHHRETLLENQNLRHFMIPMTLGLVTLCNRADAGFVIDVQQVGNNVVTKGSGEIDLTGLTNVEDNLSNSGALMPDYPFISVGGPTFINEWGGVFTKVMCAIRIAEAPGCCRRLPALADAN